VSTAGRQRDDSPHAVHRLDNVADVANVTVAQLEIRIPSQLGDAVFPVEKLVEHPHVVAALQQFAH